MSEEEKLIIGKRCYVGNLAWKTSWQDLKDKFRPCGNVVYANVMRTDDGRSKGWGIVEFDTPEEAYKAVREMNGSDLKGRPLNVREDREDRDVKNYYHDSEQRPAPSDRREGKRGGGRGGGGAGRGSGGIEQGVKIVVHGLPISVTKEEFHDFFMEKIGGVVQANVPQMEDGKSRGWGTVEFESNELAHKAVETLNGSTYKNRQIKVRFDKYS